MTFPAPLRLVVNHAENPGIPPPLTESRPAPPTATPDDKALVFAASASFVVHAVVLASMAITGIFGEERADGLGEDVVLIEGIPVELVEAAPVPEAPPIEAAPEAESFPATEPLPEPAEPAPVSTEEAAEFVTERPAKLPPPPEPETGSIPEPVPEVLPPTDAETGELSARPEDAETAPMEEGPPTGTTDNPPAERESPAPDAATVPTPRAKPERTEVAEAEPPPEPQEEQEDPSETAPAPPKPTAPPPSAPSAASTAARGGAAGGGGASQTAGSAAASAYRAKVAAQLKRKRFYPNAARRERLTGSTTVSFTLNASGRVTAVRVVRSSGKKILDDAAKEMVERASPYPPIPPGLGPTITIQAPIAFDLPR